MVGMGDFGMKQQREEPPIPAGHCGHRRVRARRGDRESRRRRGDEIAMAGPHAQLGRRRREKRRARFDVNRRMAELAVRGRRDRPAERVRHQLHAVADAQDRHRGVEHAVVTVRRRGIRHARRPARQDDAGRLEAGDRRERRVERQDFAIDGQLPQPAGNQLGELRAEVQDDKCLVFHWERLSQLIHARWHACKGRQDLIIRVCLRYAPPYLVHAPRS